MTADKRCRCRAVAMPRSRHCRRRDKPRQHVHAAAGRPSLLGGAAIGVVVAVRSARAAAAAAAARAETGVCGLASCSLAAARVDAVVRVRGVLLLCPLLGALLEARVLSVAPVRAASTCAVLVVPFAPRLARRRRAVARGGRPVRGAAVVVVVVAAVRAARRVVSVARRVVCRASTMRSVYLSVRRAEPAAATRETRPAGPGFVRSTRGSSSLLTVVMVVGPVVVVPVVVR